MFYTNLIEYWPFIISLGLSEIPLVYQELLSRKKGFLLFVKSVLLLYIYNDLGFNLATKKFTFLFERACVAHITYHTAYFSVKDI